MFTHNEIRKVSHLKDEVHEFMELNRKSKNIHILGIEGENKDAGETNIVNILKRVDI